MKSAALALALALAAGAAAQAQTAAEALLSAPLRAPPQSLAMDLAEPRPAFTPRYAHAPEPRIAGVARTSLDRRLSDEGVVGSLGFLCGLEPGAERKAGAAATRGYDPTGRFVGAKLRLAFR